MRLITRTELTHRSKYDLEALPALALLEIRYAKQGSPEWYRAIVSLANIRQELAAQKMTPKAAGAGFLTAALQKSYLSCAAFTL